jgi:hypothetical protein
MRTSEIVAGTVSVLRRCDGVMMVQGFLGIRGLSPSGPGLLADANTLLSTLSALMHMLRCE